MQTEFQEYFEDFFKEEEQKLRVMLELKLKAAKNSDKTQYHLEDNPQEFNDRFQDSQIKRVHHDSEDLEGDEN